MTDLAERVVVIALCGGLLGLILELVRRKRLQERYALLWLLTSVMLLVLAAWNGLLTMLSSWVGIHYPPSTLFAVALGLELILLLHFSLAVSRLTDHNKVLAQHIALLEHTVRRQGEQISALSAGDAEIASNSALPRDDASEVMEPSEASEATR